MLLLALLAARAARRYARAVAGEVAALPPLAALATGRATLLYFHGDKCGDCLRQERQIDRLLSARPELAIRADHAPSELSRHFRVLTVPSTVVLDGAGRAHAVNYGFVASATLERQLDALERALSETA